MFEETQNLRHPAVLVLCGAIVLLVLIFLPKRILPLYTGEDANLTIAIIATTSLLLGLAAVALVLSVGLRLRVGEEGLEYRVFPLGAKTIPGSAVTSAELVTFRPIRDFGGYGVRYGKMGKGYIFPFTEGRGVRLQLADEKYVVFSSRDPEGLLAAIEAARSKP